MDKEKFLDTMPGKLARINEPLQDWAFIPSFLPADWTPSMELMHLVGNAKLKLGELKGKGGTLPNPDLLLHPLQRRESITSSRLEGTRVEPAQLILFELDEKKEATTPEADDGREVWNYTEALRHGFNELQHRELSTQLIKEMHHILMQRARGDEASPGLFRKKQVIIGYDGRFIPPPYEHVDSLMDNLETQIRRDDLTPLEDPLIHCFLIHYQFETIHPFEDGNGRVGRLILALMIYKLLDLGKPWLYMSAFFERFKEDYTGKLFNVSSRGDWDEWIRFCLHGAIQQAEDAIRRCELFDHLKADFTRRLDSAENKSTRMSEITSDLFATPLLTIPSVQKKWNVHYSTARKDIQKLEDLGILQRAEGNRPISFYSEQIFAIAFGKPEAIQAAHKELLGQ